MDRAILHVDLNNFFASVECLYDNNLIGRPVAVCGDPEKRHGIILAKNELAKKYKIKTGDTVNEALEKCAELQLVHTHFERYAKYSKDVKNLYYKYTDRIESFGMDECWLDVTASQKLFGNPEHIANIIREDVKQTIGLTVSVGVSFTKVFAKLGSDMKKPDAVTVISRDNYKKLVWPLPISDLLFVGRKTMDKLKKLNVTTIGDIAVFDEDSLTQYFGITAGKLIASANGIETDEVMQFANSAPVKSVGNGSTAMRDLVTDEEIQSFIFFLSDIVSARLRKYGYAATGIALTVRDNNLDFSSKQMAILSPTNSTEDISRYAFEIFKSYYNIKRMPAVRALTISTFNLVNADDAFQIDMFSSAVAKKRNLDSTIDELKNRFGKESITRGVFLGNDLFTDVHNHDDDALPFQRQNREL